MSKERIKGIVVGFIMCVVFSASAVVVSAQTVMLIPWNERPRSSSSAGAVDSEIFAVLVIVVVILAIVTVMLFVANVIVKRQNRELTNELQLMTNERDRLRQELQKQQ